MAKPHLIISDVPLTSPTARAVCGKPVVRVASIASDLDLQSVELSSLTRCTQCRAGLATKHAYVYIGLEIKECPPTSVVTQSTTERSLSTGCAGDVPKASPALYQDDSMEVVK